MIYEILTDLLELIFPSKKQLLEWELEEIRKIRSEIEVEKNLKSTYRVIENTNQLVEKMIEFTKNPNINLLRSIRDYILGNEECPSCRSLISLAYAEFDYGNIYKSIEIIKELIEIYSEDTQR